MDAPVLQSMVFSDPATGRAVAVFFDPSDLSVAPVRIWGDDFAEVLELAQAHVQRLGGTGRYCESRGGVVAGGDVPR